MEWRRIIYMYIEHIHPVDDGMRDTHLQELVGACLRELGRRTSESSVRQRDR